MINGHLRAAMRTAGGARGATCGSQNGFPRCAEPLPARFAGSTSAERGEAQAFVGLISDPTNGIVSGSVPYGECRLMATANGAIRQEVITVCRVLDGLGLVEGFGHVSVRQPDGNVLITPARAPGLVRPDEFLTFNLEGELVAGDDGTGPLERWMHFAVYRARPDIRAIARTHSRMAAALGVANTPIFTAHGFGGMLGAVVPVHPENDLITDDAMGQAVAASLNGNAGVLLRGNGALVTGTTLPQACVRAIYLEEAAWLQVTAAGVGGVVPFTVDELNARSRWHEAEMERAWHYYSAKFGV